MVAVLKAAADYITDVWPVVFLPPVFYVVIVLTFMWSVTTGLFLYTAGAPIEHPVGDYSASYPFG